MIGINIVLLLLAIACDVKIELIPLLSGVLDLIVPVFVSLTHVSTRRNIFTVNLLTLHLPGGLVVRIRRSHRRGRGSIPRLGRDLF